MGIGKSIKSGFSKVVSPSQWMGTESLKQSGRLIGDSLKKVFVSPKNVSQKETAGSFDEALEKYNISPEALLQRIKSARITAYFCAAAALLLLVYSFYLFFNTGIVPGLVSIALTVMALSYAMKMHVLYFKLKTRKIRCTYAEWFNFLKGHAQ